MPCVAFRRIRERTRRSARRVYLSHSLCIRTHMPPRTPTVKKHQLQSLHWYTLLGAACFLGVPIDFLECILEHEGPSCITDLGEEGETPFWLACSKGHVHMLDWLSARLDPREDVELARKPNTEGLTPLFVACRGKHWATCEWLIAHGAEEDMHGVRTVW